MNDDCRRMNTEIITLYNVCMPLRSLRLILSILLAGSMLSCARQAPLTTHLFAVRLDPPALVEFAPDLKSIVRELPLTVASGCMVWSVVPAPAGSWAALELYCESGPAVFLIDTNTGTARLMVDDTDSRFLAWAADSETLYLRVDTTNEPRIVRVTPGGRVRSTPLPGAIYNLAALPDGQVVASLTYGLGLGSETWLAGPGGEKARRIASDAEQIVTFLRPSPDGNWIAFINMPDSQTPFPSGELWIMKPAGTDARKLATVDAGHGYPPAWSPDSASLAFVFRENPSDPAVTENADALASNIHAVNLPGGNITAITHFEDALIETPTWSPDGGLLAFDMRVSGKISTWAVEPGREPFLLGDGLYCPFWVRK
jgi:hypothetical protein